MEAGIMVIIAVVCLTIGIIAGRFTKKTTKTHGILNVDCSDPANGAYLYLELAVPIAEVAEAKQVTFNVQIIR